MIRFGWPSSVLLLGVTQGIIVTALLLAHAQNRSANRLLAALTFALSLRIVPFVLGYAGFYDADPWLSFAPFAITLAYGPLIYLYVVRLTTDALPHRWWLHFAPAVVQVTYDTILFAQPLPFKNAWDVSIHERWIDPLENVLTLASFGIYLAAAVRRYRHYRRWLDAATTQTGERRLPWLRNVLVLLSLTLALAAGFAVYSAFVRPLSYVDVFGLYVWYAALAYYLGLEGWRNAARTYPQPIAPSMTADPPVLPAPPVARDWAAAANLWEARVTTGRYWRDPDLTLATLASALDMSVTLMSRTINEGLGQNFNEAINRMRVAAVAQRLADPAETRDVLAIAFDEGFNSKASFNRCFKTFTGVTPTQYRRAPLSQRLTS